MLPGDAKTDFEVGATTKIKKVAQAEQAAREEGDGASSPEDKSETAGSEE